MHRIGILLVALAVSPDATAAPPPACSQQCPITRSSLAVSSDPGHGGAAVRYLVERSEGSHEARVSRSPPVVDAATGELLPRSSFVLEPTEQGSIPAAEVAAFLDELAALDVCALESPQSVIGLHPTFLTLEIADACGNRREVRWVGERFEAFFGKPR